MTYTAVLALAAICSLSLAAPAHASAEQEFLVDVRCGPAVRVQLESWHVRGEVFQDPGDLPGTRSWRLATERPGVWAVVSVDGGLDPSLALVDARETRLVTFDSGCTASTEVLRRTAPSDTQAFDDRDLDRLLKREPAGVICIWSPHMSLSVDACKRVGHLAQVLGLPATVLLDPNSSASYARTTAMRAGLPVVALSPFRSVELVFRQATTHAPSILVYKNGRILGAAVPGYRDEAAYESLIRSRLEER